MLTLRRYGSESRQSPIDFRRGPPRPAIAEDMLKRAAWAGQCRLALKKPRATRAASHMPAKSQTRGPSPERLRMINTQLHGTLAQGPHRLLEDNLEPLQDEAPPAAS